MDGSLSYVHLPFCDVYRYETVSEIMHRVVEQHQDAEAFVHYKHDQSRESITFSELYKKATKLARYFVSLGIKRGDTVALFGANSINWVIAQVGLIISGAKTIYVNLASKDVTSVCDIFSLVSCKAFCVDPGKNGEYHEALSQMIDFMKTQKNCINPKDNNPNILLLTSDEQFKSYPEIQRIVETDLSEDIQLPSLYPEDTVIILTTSGSTGKPKLVEHTHFNVANIDIRYSYKLKEQGLTKIFNDRPFGWVGGSPLSGLCEAQTRVFVDSSLSLRGDSTECIWNIIRFEKCHAAILLPFILDDLLNMEDKILDSFKLETAITGGQVIKGKLLNVIGKFAKKLIVAYASTETLFISVVEIGGKNWDETVGNVGKPCPGVEVKIVDEYGNVTKRKQSGEIYIKSQYLFKGYMCNPEANQQVVGDRGWFKIGDTGFISEEGNIVIQGRTKDIISRGTRKIIPESVEGIIQQMIGLQNVTVLGVPDDRLHEEVCACFITKTESDVKSEDVEQYCREKFMSKTAVDGLGEMPKYFLKFDEFPKLPNGKPDKVKLKSYAVSRLFGK